MTNVANLQLGATETTIATGGAINRNLLSVKFFNTSATTTQTVTLFHYPSGGSGIPATTVDMFSILPQESHAIPKDQLILLGNGDVFSGLASSGATITVTTNYVDR
jgi:hypothetical protein